MASDRGLDFQLIVFQEIKLPRWLFFVATSAKVATAKLDYGPSLTVAEPCTLLCVLIAGLQALVLVAQAPG
jgi:hypothetical protein